MSPDTEALAPIPDTAAEEAERAAELERRREQIRARVMHLFRHQADVPGAQALLHAVLAFRQERLK